MKQVVTRDKCECGRIATGWVKTVPQCTKCFKLSKNTKRYKQAGRRKGIK